MNRLIENTKKSIHRLKNVFGRDVFTFAFMQGGINGFDNIKYILQVWTNDENKSDVEEYVKFINDNLDDIINYTSCDKIFVDNVIIFQR